MSDMASDRPPVLNHKNERNYLQGFASTENEPGSSSQHIVPALANNNSFGSKEEGRNCEFRKNTHPDRHDKDNDDDEDGSNQYFFSEPSLSEDGDSSSIIRAPQRININNPVPRNNNFYPRTGGFFSSSDDEVHTDNDNNAVSGKTDNSNDNNNNSTPSDPESKDEEQPKNGPRPSTRRRRRMHQQDYTLSPGNTSLSSRESPAVEKKVLLQFVMPESKYAKQARLQRRNQSISSNGNARAKGSNGTRDHVHNRKYTNQGSDLDMCGLSASFDSAPIMPKIERKDENPKIPSTGSRPDKISTEIISNGHRSYRSSSPALSSISGDSAFFGPLHRSGSVNNSPSSNSFVSGDHYQNSFDSSSAFNAQSQRLSSMSNSTSTKGNFQRGHHQRFSYDDSVVMTLSDSEVGDVLTVDDSDIPLDWEVQHSADDEKTTDRPPRIKVKPSPGHRRTRSGDGAAANLVTKGTDWKGMHQDKIPLPEIGEDEDESPMINEKNRKSQRFVRRHAEKALPRYTQSQHRRVNSFDPGLIREKEGTNPLPSMPSRLPPLPARDPGRENKTQSDDSNENVDGRQAWVNQMALVHQKALMDHSVSSFSLSQHDSPLEGSLHSLEETPDENSGEESGSTSEEDEDERDIHLNQLQFESPGSLDELERMYENRQFRGSEQAVLRHALFDNIGKKTVERIPRQAYLPTQFDDNQDYPTFICPRCKTRQREFFTAESIAGRLEGPGSYLALYFSFYVVCSLFIFGIEEGWMPLDCIYFAVITLTTAGLGDFVPTTDANKIICSIFIYFGVACIGLLLGSYIAGMLDDRASRNRRERQIESCPNCARIKTIKEAVEKREEEVLLSSFSEAHANPAHLSPRRFMSERAPTEMNTSSYPAVYKPLHHHHHQHHQHQHQHRDDGNVGFSEQDQFVHGIETCDSVEEGFSFHSPEISFDDRERERILGSPFTRQILGRQRHTRHESLGISSSQALLGSKNQRANYGTTPARSFSEEIHSGSNRDTDCSSVPGRLRRIESGQRLDEFSLSDDESPDSSTSSESTADELWDHTKSKIQAAKYVFLTLKVALVNSMVIIACGCLGFCLIEKFTIVDSWYFTTVLLTTVGYGDIFPTTRGGKLFATIYILVAGTILLNNMSSISMIPLELRRRRIERAVLTQFGDHLDDAALRELATGPLIQRLRLSANRTDGLDECTREMFSLAMLVRLGKVTEQDIRETFASFRHLDVNNEGVLNSGSIIAAMIAKQRRTAVNVSVPPPPPPPPHPQHEEDVGMRKYWFGRRGSLHVETEDTDYHFHSPEEDESYTTNNSAASEDSPLLHIRSRHNNSSLSGFHNSGAHSS